ncbi:hypothetical protein [Neisseria polysaccharea]|nr:hypothetical protein [Neisseria polysaccharea]
MPSETGFRRHLNKRGNQAVGSEKPTSARLKPYSQSTPFQNIYI